MRTIAFLHRLHLCTCVVCPLANVGFHKSQDSLNLLADASQEAGGLGADMVGCLVKNIVGLILIVRRCVHFLLQDSEVSVYSQPHAQFSLSCWLPTANLLEPSTIVGMLHSLCCTRRCLSSIAKNTSLRNHQIKSVMASAT